MRQVKGNVSVISSNPLWQCTVQNGIIKNFAWSSIKVDGNVKHVKKNWLQQWIVHFNLLKQENIKKLIK